MNPNKMHSIPFKKYIRKKMLYDYLDEECILCSKEMVESIQTDFGKDEKFEWDLI